MNVPTGLRRTARALALLTLFCVSLASADDGSARLAAHQARTASALPVWFEPNVGQFPADTVFGSASTHSRLDLTRRGFDVSVASPDVRRTLSMHFAGSREDVTIAGVDRLAGATHYYLGNDRSQWREHVAQFGKVRFTGVWDGIDAIVYSTADRLEYDFIVAPGRSPRAIALDVLGADDVRVDASGALVVSIGGSQIVQRAPVAYQDLAGTQQAIDVAYHVDGNRVTFDVGAYDTTQPLVIDPIVIVYASFLGGSAAEFFEPNPFDTSGAQSQTAGLAIDGAGNLYVALDTYSANFPGATNTISTGPDLVVAKINPSASAVVWATHIGGTGTDTRGNLELDGSGNVYLSGRTTSPTLPIPDPSRAIRTSLPTGDPADGLFARLSPTGTLQYLTYIGGSGSDSAEAIAVSGTKAFLTGSTSSTNLPVTSNAAQPTFGGEFDAWVAAFDLSQTAPLEYLSYVGGTKIDAAFSIAVDSVGRVTIAGGTESAVGFPISVNAFQVSMNGGSDAFVTRFAPNGTIEYSTYIGGSSTATLGSGGGENAKVAVAPDGALLLVGFTDSTNFPAGVSGTPFQANKAGGHDVFVAKLDPSYAPAQQLRARTYVGGTASQGGDFGIGVAQDATGNVYVTGFSSSPDFPMAGAVDSTLDAGFDAFVVKLDPTLSTLLFSTFLGGGGHDRGYAIGADPTGNIYVTGRTESLAPFTGGPKAAGGGAALGPARSGSIDAFIVKYGESAAPTASTIFPIRGTTAGGTPFTITGTGFQVGLGVTFNGNPATNLQVTNTTINGLTPPGTAGSVPVAVTNPGGTPVNVTGGYEYVVPGPAPTVTSVTPSSGSIVGGTIVTITGTNFVAGPGQQGQATGLASFNRVVFDATDATNVTVVSPTTITATTPAHAAGPVTVTVVNPDGGVGTLPNGYTYVTDSDGDGIPDDWEIIHGFDPYDPGDATGDPDDDGATNEKEYLDGTDPRVAETKYFAEGATIGIFTTQFGVANPDRFRTVTTVFEFQTKTGAVLRTTRTLPPMSRVTVVPSTDVPGLEAAEFSTVIRSNLFIAADRTMTWDHTVYGAHAETGVPRPSDTWYLAEGATIGAFNLFYLIQNPNAVPVTVHVKYLLSNGAPVEKDYTVPAKSRDNIWVNFEDINGVSLANRELSAVLTTSPTTPIIVERAMYLDAPGQPYNAGHESAGVTAPSTSWFLAEGATGTFMDMFILVANANPTPAHLTVKYLLANGAPITYTYTADPNSRFNIWVDLEPGLENVAVSTVITSDVPVIVERALWWPTDPGSWYEAHNSPGTTATGQTWALGEGEVGGGHGVETYVLIANTSAFAGTARVTLLFEDGSPSVSKDVALPANSRVNVPVGEAEAVGGFGAAAQNKRFGVLVESLGATPAAIVVERAMYASQGSQFWAAGTNAVAARVR